VGTVLPLKEEGAEVKWSARAAPSPTASKAGYPVNVDVQADQVSAVEFRCGRRPGGYAPDMMRRHGEHGEAGAGASQQGKVVAAICHAGWMLASAGVLKGRRRPHSSAIKDDMVNAGATWIDQEVVVDATSSPRASQTIISASARDRQGLGKSA